MIISVFLLTSIIRISYSQAEINNIKKPVTLSEYLSGVMKGNLEYIAGQMNVSIAEAELKAAKVLPDPEVSVAYSNNEDKVLQMGQSVEAGISYPVNLGNKRGAGISLARSQHDLSILQLDAYLSNLRAYAAINYFVSLKDQKIFLLQEDIYKQLAGLAGADSLRLQIGEATGLDALQSSLEARSQKTEVFQSFAEMQNSSLTLMVLQGKKISDTLVKASGDFPIKERTFNLVELVKSAIENRADLLVAIKNKEISEKNIRLLKAIRAFEFNLEAGYSDNYIVKNEIAPAPAYKGMSAGISFPLKFSDLNRGSVQAAEIAKKQSQTLYEQTELQIISEVLQAYNSFVAQNKKVEHFNKGLIEDAGKILEGRIYSYQQGESGLIDVLNARRTYTELQMSYLNSLFDYTAALIELERAAGIWDITN